MKIQAINNSPNFGARIKFNKKITEGLFTDSLISSEGVGDGVSQISTFTEPIINNNSFTKNSQEPVKNSLISNLWNKYIKKIPS